MPKKSEICPSFSNPKLAPYFDVFLSDKNTNVSIKFTEINQEIFVFKKGPENNNFCMKKIT